MRNVAVIIKGKSIAGGGGAERRFARAINTIWKKNTKDRIYLVCSKNIIQELISSKTLDLDTNNKEYLIEMEKFCVFGIIVPSRMLKFLKKYNIKIIHFPLIQKSLLPLYLTLFFYRNIKVITTIASYRIAMKLDKSYLTNFVVKLLCVISIKIDSLYNYFTEYYPEYKPKTFITPCSFTDYSHFYPLEKTKTIVFAGRLVDYKQPLLVLDAFSLVYKRLESPLKDSWKLFILGNGPLKPLMKRKIDEYRLNKNVILTYQPDISNILNKSSIFISIQTHENYPSQSLLESMASENAIIATDVGNTKKLLDDRCALFIYRNSSKDLAEKLFTLIDDEKLRKKLGEEARKKVLSEHSMDIFVDYLFKLWGIDLQVSSDRI